MRIFSSLDGVTWTDVATDAFVFGAGRPDTTAREWARAVAATGSGFIVAGSQLDVPGGAIWLSDDGATWARLSAEDVFRGAGILAIGGSGDRLVAVGFAGNEPSLAVAWRSYDGGMTWERMDTDPALVGLDSQFRRLAIRGHTVLATLLVDGRAEIWTLDLDGQE